jgi:exodeoxyribonuclease V gamma subunit
VRGGAALPHGQIGRALFSREWEGVQQFAGRLQRFLPDARQTQPLTFDLTIAGIRLSGRLAPLAPDGLFGYRLAPVTARDQLSLWLQHLLLNIIAPAGIEPVSRWLGQDREVILRPVSDAQAQLEQFLSYYRQGLNRPLMFFPKSAFTYVEAASAKNQRTAP